MIRKRFLIVLIVLANACIITPSHHLSHVFSNAQLRTQFASFIDTVLRQTPSKTFYDYVNILDLTQDDTALYEQLLAQRSHFTPTFAPLYQLNSLRYQKKELGLQAHKLLAEHLNTKRTFQGCLEIGNPGAYTSVIQNFATIIGPIYAMNESEGFSDRFQYNGIKPYDHFIPLNDYAALEDRTIADKSVELIICFRGFHHIPIEKLDAFVASLARVLKPGGVLLLRDHDVKSSDLAALVNCAHSVFNLIIGAEPLTVEQAEYRNFQPLEYWIALLEKHGLFVSSERMLQKGDPTLNTMIKATKVPCGKQEELEYISTSLKHSPDYHQDITQTYLTAPEWYNVDVAQEYGSYINHTPFYQFPYMKHVATYWKIFAESWKVAAHKKGHWQVLSSPYTLMNLFVGSSMTVEHAAKAVISAPIRWMYAGVPVMPLQALIEDPCNEIMLLDQNIKIIKSYAHNNLKLVALPRYKQFTACMAQLACTNIVIHEIAGNKEIQIKARYKRATHFNSMNGCIKNFEWQVPTQPDYTYCGLTVQVNLLHKVLADLQTQHVEVLHIHDF